MTTPRDVLLAQLEALDSESSQFRSTMDGLANLLGDHLNVSGQHAATASELRATVKRLESEKAELEEFIKKLSSAFERMKSDRDYAVNAAKRMAAEIADKDTKIKRLTEAQTTAQKEPAPKPPQDKE